MIKITHFVNPHKFFFRHKENEDFDKPLDEMEMKIKGTVGKKMQSEDESEEILIGDIVAAFMPDANKWIRGAVKSKDQMGWVYVWAIDYGVPIISSATKIFKLPPIYAKMNIKYQRVFLGGLINCVPAESAYDFEIDSVTMNELTNWSAHAIHLAQKIIGRGMNLKFDEIEEVRLPNGPHLFGHLKIQKADSSWVDLSNCLSNASVAKITNDTWATHAHRLDTINQQEWITMDGMLLQATITVAMNTTEQIANEMKLQSAVKEENMCHAKPQQNNNMPTNEENQQVAIGQQNEDGDNKHLNLSAGYSRGIKRRDLSSSRSVTPHGINFRGGGRPNRYQHQSRQNDYGPRYNESTSRQNDYGSQFPKGWHSNGKLNNQRYREEIEYFESGFRPPITSTKKEESSPSESPTKESKEMKTNMNEADAKETSNENDTKDEKPTKTESSEVVPSEKGPTEIKPSEIKSNEIKPTENEPTEIKPTSVETAPIEVINAQEPKNDDTETKQKEDNSNGGDIQVNA